MAVSNGRQLLLLLWKNWLLQKRRIPLTIFLILLPALFTFILLLIRVRVPSEFIGNNTIWDSFSANTSLPWNLTLPLRSVGSQRNDPRWRLAYAPNTPVVTRIANATAMLLAGTNATYQRMTLGRGFATESDLEAFFADQNASYTSLVALVFDTSSIRSDGLALITGQTIAYKIRLRSEGYSGTYQAQGTSTSSTRWQTNRLFAFQLKPGPQGNMYGGNTPGYYYEGFLAIQRAADISIMQALGVNQPSADLQLKSFPYPPYFNDSFLFFIQTQLPFIIMISFIVLAPTITKDVVLEKEKKQKESMKLMGMKVWLHWLAWFIKFFIFMLISVILMTILFHAKVGGKKIITYTAPTVTFVFLLLYALSVIMFCFAISSFFSKASAGAAVAGICYLGTYIPYFILGSTTTYPTLSSGTKAGCSLLCNLAMGIGCQIISSFESTGVGVQWSNINKPVTADDQFTMLYIFLMLILDIVLYGLITWYFDALLPGDFGTPQPFYFPFTKWYWCGRSSNAVEADWADVEVADRAMQNEFIEKPPPGAKVGIRIRNLTKEFKSTVRPAVNKLSIDMYEGHITALLGHNGAGKTTTMFMLTGFLPATSGTAFINGLDLSTDLSKIRQNLGLCPQHDILFDTMTVEEHLTFFAQLKGCPRSEVPAEVNRMIGVLHLENKRGIASKKLSGGMKRKLSVGIALIGGSKFVILDEPTSGMDPEARRQTWDILQGQRAGRTMILSTHFMDEADLLGDRIAIMAEGQLQCCGSSLFLKGKYGIGYHLTVVKNSNHVLDRTVQRIKQYVPDAELESNVGAELAFILPRECSGKFEELFTDLEQNRHELGIDSFGASVTTLEEVFLKVGEMCDTSLQNQLHKGLESDGQQPPGTNGYDNESYVNDTSTENRNSRTPTSVDIFTKNDKSLSDSKKPLNGNGANQNGYSTSCGEDELFGVRFCRVQGLNFLMQQLRALFVKHFIHTVRNIIVTVVQILVPIVFTIVACIIEKYGFQVNYVMPALPLNLSYFSNPIVPYTAYGSTVASLQPLVAGYSDSASQFAGSKGQLNYANGQNMDEFLVNIAKGSMDQYNRYYMAAGTVSSDTEGAALIGHFNNIALHAIGISLSMIDNAVLQTAVADGTVKSGTRIETINHPLPPSLSSQTSALAAQASTVGFTFSYCLSFGMAFLVATFVVFVVNENSVKAKHAQFVTGVRATNFWLAAYMWDILCFLVPSVLIIIVVLAFQTSGFSDKDVVGIVFLDLAMYGWSVIPFAYLLSFLFSVASTAYTWILVINIFTGTVAVLTVYILQIPALETVDIGNALEWVFYVLLPNFCFNKGLQDLYKNFQYQSACAKLDAALPTGVTRTTYCQLIVLTNNTNPCCADACGSQCANINSNYMGWAAPGIGRSLVFMAIQGALFSVILIFLESDIIQLIKQLLTARESNYPLQEANNTNGTGPNHNVELSEYGTLLIEDDDVKAERQRVYETLESDLSKTHNVIFRELTKFYNGTFLAVDRLSLAIPSGECFGLLGVNGAGKTTTFKMLTGDETISAGEAWLDGVNVRKSIQRARERVGYCPQFDALIDQMTVRETLWMYARMRGIGEKDINHLVERMIVQLTLEPHVDKQAKNLSGGNRRKLSIGVALIGNPQIVFLDEPTTGMDPVARRLLWNTLTAVRDGGRTLILTSHSMEECEALCTRIAIMVNGRFQCLGATQHLKAKFGEGYSLIIKVNPGSTSADDVEDSSSPFRRNRPRSSSARGQRGQSVSSASGGHETNNEDHHATELDVRMRLVMEFVMQKFPGSQLKDKHDGLLHYRVLPTSVPDASNEKQSASQQISWAYVFGEIERAKERLHIEDYSVSQTSLEQVFISFARMQRPPQDVQQQTCCGCWCMRGACCCKNKEDDG